MLLYFLRHHLNLSLVLLMLLLSGCASTDKPPVAGIYPAGMGNARAVADAMQLQGHPYVYGGKSPREGFDCSGLVVYVYDQQGLRLPRTTQSLARQLPGVNPDQRLPGDLLFFNTDKPFSHVGIYVGDDNFVHAPSARTGRVMLSSLRQPYWRERFMAVRRPQQFQSLSQNTVLDGICAIQ
ncbi:C40 family peptidase [Methylomonas sp. LL1]|uniref:C40 family peptidase n=1 Tax=Methylomonas sp. LL1 TaxID=2785785 RepID=UPI0018C3BF0B|nr:C40 family peptidase [Methylomonas sp. LL1]QPK62787.1 C40 family peptidase [Methylomonas sp. LL1]